MSVEDAFDRHIPGATGDAAAAIAAAAAVLAETMILSVALSLSVCVLAKR